MEFEIVSGQPDDAASVVACMRQVCGETDYLMTSPETFSLTEEKERELLAHPVTEDKYLFLFFAKVSGQVVGSASLFGSLHPRRGHIGGFGISILKDFWRQGMGNALMDAIVDKGKAFGLHGIQLDVREDNTRAIRLYERHGFVQDGRHRHAMKVGDRYYDLIHMTLIFGEDGGV